MCRIAGIISNERPLAVPVQQVELMCDVMKHGGPDDSGIFTDEACGVVLGHRRLSIIDLSSAGHQPMADCNKRAWITFNGEIYNYPELKAELIKAGARFHSGSDTEVIINVYLFWGVAGFRRLRGMFAFALYDAQQSRTYLVRDATGIKPLYYHIAGKSLSFASEVRAFRKVGIATEADSSWQIRFLAFGHIPEPYTTLKGVFSLAKGHYLEWENRTGAYRISRFDDSEIQKSDIFEADKAKALLREAMQTAVERQLISDAPIGVFLSGGTDSSLITLLASRYERQQLKTVSIYFEEKEYDERAYQNAVLRQIGGEQYSHLVKQEDFEAFFPRIMDDMDMPTTDGINTWFISKYAREDGLKAVLSGVGADELFGGYPSFERIKYLRRLRQLPPGLFGVANYFHTDRYRKIVFLTQRHPLADYLFLRGIFVPSEIAGILDCDIAEVNRVLFSDRPFGGPASYDEIHAAWFETNLYMQNQLLRDTDVMSMSHGLEVRVPFLDEDLQSLAGKIAPEIRFDNSRPKKLLTDTFSDLLPPTVWDRPKMGFTFPLQQWMRQYNEITNELLYEGSAARDIVRRFKAGKMHWSKLFALYQIQIHD